MSDIDRLEQLLDELVRLVALQVRQQIATQNEAILAMADAGFGPTRIAQLLGTTANTVNVALSKARKAKKQPRQTSEVANDTRSHDDQRGAVNIALSKSKRK